MGANPVQIEVGEFDEAIEIVEDDAVESTSTHTTPDLRSAQSGQAPFVYLQSHLKDSNQHKTSLICSNVAVFLLSVLLKPSPGSVCSKLQSAGLISFFFFCF